MELAEVKNKQITEPDFIYDGENHLVKMGSERYQSFIHLLSNNYERMTFRKHKHFICLTCWQFIGILQKAKHDSLLHKTVDPSECHTEEQFLKFAAHYEKTLEGTTYVMPFKHYHRSRMPKPSAI